MTRVAPPRLLLVVDTYALSDSELEHVERAIAMAASLASAALEQEMAVGICAWAGKPASIAPTRGKQQREEALSLLAELPRNTVCNSGQLLDEAESMMRSGTTLVMFSPRDFRPSRAEQGRGGLIVISSASEAAQSWFRFRPGVSFVAETSK